MHINPWAKGQSNAVGRGWHAGHREHSRDAAKSLQQQATQDVVAALRKRLVSDTSAAQADGSATDAPMQTLVATVQSAISLRASSGADPVPDVLGAVRSALSDARAALVKSGASDEDAEKAVSSVSQQLGAALNAAPATNTAAATSAAAATAPPATTTAGSSESTLSVSAAASNYVLTYVRKQKASLDILTQDGDRIQIRFRAKEAVTATGSTVSNTTSASSSSSGASSAAGAAASSATGSTPAASATTSNTTAANATATNAAAGSSPATATAGGTSAATKTAAPGSSIHAFASGSIEVSVQGQLSADELKAIGDLAGKVDALANEFFQGDLQQAFTAAASLGFDSTQIAGFALKLSQQESVRQSGALPATKPAAAPASSASPAVAAPAAATPVATPVTTPVTAPASPVALDGATSASTVPATDVASSASSTATAPASADAQAATLQETLSGFVRKVLDTMATPNSSGRLEFSMRWKLSLVVAAVEAGAPKSTQGSDAGTSLLTRSIKDVAAQAPISLAPANLPPASA